MSLDLLTGDEVLTIFANLEQLLDFQRRFLISMESTLSQPQQEQRIGMLFIQHVGLNVQMCASLFYRNNISVSMSLFVGTIR